MLQRHSAALGEKSWLPRNATPDHATMQTKTLLLVGAVLAATIGTPARAQTSSCRPADSYGPRLVSDLQQLVTATDPGVIAARDSFYHIPVVSPTAITLVTDAQTCSKAAQALSRFEDSRQMITATSVTTAGTMAASTSRTVVVAKVGTYWAVVDPNAAPDGRFLTVVLFDSKWRQVGGYTGP